MRSSFSLRLPEETEDKLESLAKSTGRTKSFIAINAIEEYVNLQAWQVEAIKIGLEQIDKGEVVSHEEVKKVWKERCGN